MYYVDLKDCLKELGMGVRIKGRMFKVCGFKELIDVDLKEFIRIYRNSVRNLTSRFN